MLIIVKALNCQLDQYLARSQAWKNQRRWAFIYVVISFIPGELILSPVDFQIPFSRMVSIRVNAGKYGPSQTETQNSDPRCRPGTSSASLKKNLRKAITPLRSIGAWIAGLVRMRLSSRNTGRESIHAVHERMEVSNDAAIEDRTLTPQIAPMQPVNNLDAVENQERSVHDSEPYEALATLPLELLIEIMKYLEWRTILQLRKVKYLFIYCYTMTSV